jgi:2,3-bisphosphoglycerate-dependent phosphoglycerate mutase
MQEMENMLVLVRHGQSEWNRLNQFTGWVDVPLTEKGIEEAKEAGRRMAQEGMKFDLAFTSHLIRAWKTLILILDEIGQQDLPMICDKALNERNYGALAGLNKDSVRAICSPEQVHIWRRSYDIAPPGEDGESLKDTAERTLPFFEGEIMPQVLAGKKIIVSAHGNSLRSIVMKLDDLSEEEVTQLNIPTGKPMIYRFNPDGSVASKEDWGA